MLDEWLASFAFSRTMRHAPRDFSDAVLMAELLSQLLPPGAVGLHNYPSTGRFQQKLVNWDILNRKVLAPLHCELSRQQMEDLAGAVPGAISVLLVRVKQQIDKTSSFRSLGKPPRSPTKTSQPGTSHSSTAPKMLGAARSVPKEQSSPLSFSSRSQQASNVVQKASGSRSPSVASPTPASAKTVSPATPSTPRQGTTAKRISSPARSEFSVLDYLPTSNERPTSESLPSTFARVLQMTEPRLDGDFKIQATRSTHFHPARSPATSPLRPHRELSKSMRPSQRKTKSQSFRSELSLSSVLPDCSYLRIDVAPSTTSSLRDEEPRPIELCEGSFARLDCLDGEEDQSKPSQLARVVRNLPSGDCLVQLFKPFVPRETVLNDETKPRSDSFVSTPHFIECCSSQLRPVQGIHYDLMTSSWTVGSLNSFDHAWAVSPTYAKPSSPLCQYTTTVLSRHKFTAIGSHAPIELRAIEPGSSGTNTSAPQPPTETPVNQSEILPAEELCAKPTVFPPVPVDLSTILGSLPPRFPPSSKKTGQAYRIP